jgi:hypothetical protein
MKLFGALALTLMSTSILAGNARDAENFGHFDYNFNGLPLEGKLADGTRAWSGDYWAFKLGNINLRWNSPNPIGYKLVSPSRDAVMSMREDQLAALAPSEKWSIFQGDYTYDLVMEVNSYSGKNKPLWAGICHGWAPASLYHQEPTPKVLVSKDGVRVPFGSGDIKAILSYFYADQQVSSGQVGRKCLIGRWLGTGGCGGDVNPAALHVIMANMLGKNQEGFIMDRDAGREVWNQPVSGFKTMAVSPIRRTSNGYTVNVETQLYYTDESKPTWDVVYGTQNQKNAVMELEYTLKLDNSMNIIDGDWNSGTFPDFLWITPKLTEYTERWSELNQLLND